jgi:hypothetical protein
MQCGLQYTLIAPAVVACCNAASVPTAYAGFSLDVDGHSLVGRFPGSEHEFTGGDGRIVSLRDGAAEFRKVIARASGRYAIRVTTNEVVGNVHYVEANLKQGALRSLRLSFERPAGTGRGADFTADFERRHPSCAPILARIRQQNGEPSRSGTSVEERLVKQSYFWTTDAERLELVCGHYEGRRAVFALDVVISRTK